MARTLFITLLIAAAAFAQAAENEGDVFCYFGHTGEVEQVDLAKMPKNVPISKALTTGTVSWNVTYQDVVTNSGKGFAGSQGAQARAALESALSYISSVITNVATVDLTVEVSQTDGSGYLAYAGTYFFASSTGFSNGFAFERITKGTDPSSSTPYDAKVTFDFGYPFHFSASDPTPSGKYDLKSLAIHEITHSLGFLSLTGSSGASTANGIRAFIDSKMETGNGKKLIAADGSGSFIGAASDLVGGDGGVVLNDGQAKSANGGVAPQLYAPNPFKSGTSLSHFDYSVAGAVMHPTLSIGSTKRAYTMVEQATLASIGYSVGSQPTPTPSISPSPTPSGVTQIYGQNFNGGTGDWMLNEGQKGLWHATTACASGAWSGTEGWSLAYTQDGGCTYDNGLNNFGYAFSPEIDLTAVAAPVLMTFDYSIQTEGDATFDQARVDVSSDNFVNFTTAAKNQGGLMLDPSNGWKSCAADLSAFAGKKIKIRLFFATGDDQGNNFPGWQIDNIQVHGIGGTNPTPTPTMTPAPSATPDATATPAPTPTVGTNDVDPQVWAMME